MHVDFSTATLYARRQWSEIFKILKERTCEQATLKDKDHRQTDYYGHSRAQGLLLS